jgi:2-succinyl-6-hydroxy-2,4-cyclohexadiene-1-carboxylate synthase
MTEDGWVTEDMGAPAGGTSKRPGPDRVVLVHGFTQTGASWAPVASALARHYEVMCPDAPGHGASAALREDLGGGAARLGELGPATYVGYSMGGRFCLRLAVDSPRLVRRLVLVSTTAGIDDPSQRAQRRAADEMLARRVETDGVASFVEWWLTNPLFATLPAEARAIESRLSNSAEGLASSLRLAGTGTQTPLWDDLAGLDMPVLVVTGEYDRRYGGLGERLARSLPLATHRVIAGAGHACHLEAPGAFLALLETFLAATAATATTPVTPVTSGESRDPPGQSTSPRASSAP